VQALVEHVHERVGFVLGLATGNVERGARIKLERGGLNRFFSFGGFGSDAGERERLVAVAIERGQQIAERAHGRRFSREEIFVFGDTEADVVAARAAGAVSVGVLYGSFARDELTAADPDLLVESFADPRLWSRLGLERDER
jgi:phosphoglycolate phosphatase